MKIVGLVALVFAVCSFGLTNCFDACAEHEDGHTRTVDGRNEQCMHMGGHYWIDTGRQATPEPAKQEHARQERR